MKLINKFGGLLMLCALVMTACMYEDFEEEAALIDIPSTTEQAFVRFDNAITAAIDIDEDAGTQEVGVEFPFPLEGDVSVSYTIEGNAVAGTDYTIEGTAGQVTLPFDAESTSQTNGNIVINIVRDSIMDGAKQMILKLQDANIGGANLAVGQGPLFEEVIINIADSDN